MLAISAFFRVSFPLENGACSKPWTPHFDNLSILNALRCECRLDGCECSKLLILTPPGSVPSHTTRAQVGINIFFVCCCLVAPNCGGDIGAPTFPNVVLTGYPRKTENFSDANGFAITYLADNHEAMRVRIRRCVHDSPPVSNTSHMYNTAHHRPTQRIIDQYSASSTDTAHHRPTCSPPQQ